MDTTILKNDGTALAQMVRDGQITPGELLEIAIKRIEYLNPSLNVLASYDFDMARSRSDSIKVSDSLPFAGIPFLIKDVLGYPGLPFTMGSRLFAENRMVEPTPFVERLDRSGLVVLGKTVTSEFGLLGSTETMLNGVVKNPWDERFSAMGSSGGSAAAVAAGLVPLAHASDGGGSIRIPASATGLFGFKPSRGALPASATPNDFTALVSDFCVTKSVRDSHRLFRFLREEEDPLGKKDPGYYKNKLKNLRIGLVAESLAGTPVDREVLEVQHKTANLCRELGLVVEESHGPELDGKALSEAFFLVAGSAISGVCDFMEQATGRRPDESVLEPFTLSLVEWFKEQPVEKLEKAKDTLQQSAKAMERLMGNYDLILTPVMGTPTPLLGTLSPDLDRETLIQRTESIAAFTPIQNIAGMPGMSVPLFTGSNGMPIGSHFAGGVGADELLFALAYGLEEARPWRRALDTLFDTVGKRSMV